MQGKITRISVTWAEPTGQGTRFRFYNVLPDDEMIIRAERMEDLLDDLTLICQQIQQTRDRTPSGMPSPDLDCSVRRIK
jgi:hypothetical protein